LRRIAGGARKLYPQHVDGGAEILHREPRRAPHERIAPVRADDERRSQLALPTVPVAQADSGDTPVPLDKADGLATHHQAEAREGAGLACEKIEEVPLRHEGDVAAAGRQPREIRDGGGTAGYLGM